LFNKKKPVIYSDYLLKNICQEDPNSHFSLCKTAENIFGKTETIYKDKLKGKYKFMFDLKEKQKCLITNIMERKNVIGVFSTRYGNRLFIEKYMPRRSKLSFLLM
jgi:hypothetical protein